MYFFVFSKNCFYPSVACVSFTDHTGVFLFGGTEVTRVAEHGVEQTLHEPNKLTTRRSLGSKKICAESDHKVQLHIYDSSTKCIFIYLT